MSRTSGPSLDTKHFATLGPVRIFSSGTSRIGRQLCLPLKSRFSLQPPPLVRGAFELTPVGRHSRPNPPGLGSRLFVPAGARLLKEASMTERRYRHQGDEHRITVRHSSSETSYSVDGQLSDAQVRLDPDGSVFVRLGGRTYHALVTVSKDHTDVCVDGFAFRLGHGASAAAHQHGGASTSASGLLVSPMTGRVRRVLAAEGQLVEAGATLVVVEAMKMEFPLRAIAAGTVLRVHAVEGQPIELGAPVVDLELAPPNPD